MRKMRQAGKGPWNKGRNLNLRTITDDYGVQRTFKFCPKCSRYCEATTDNFYLHRGKSGAYILQSWCKECWKIHSRKTHENDATYYQRRAQRLKNDPEMAERYREYHRKWAKKEREEHPERVAARSKKWRDKQMADPILHAILRENERIARRLRAERQGREITRKVTPTYTTPNNDYMVPAEPFIPLLLNGGGKVVDESVIRRVVSGEKKYIYLSTADKICHAAGAPLSAYLPERFTHSAD